MTKGVTIAIKEVDPDLLVLRVSAANDEFRGSVLLYADLDFTADMSASLKNFPRQPFDHELLELGTFQAGYAGGGARFTFRSVDRAGHIVLRVDLASDRNQDLPPSSVSLNLLLEAAGIDSFIWELQALGRRDISSATLLGT